MAHPAPAGGVLTGDLQKPAASPGGLPKALAIPHVAPLGRSLGDHLPGRDTGKDQAALRLHQEEVAVLVGARVVLLPPVLAHDGGHIAGREAWVARSNIGRGRRRGQYLAALVQLLDAYIHVVRDPLPRIVALDGRRAPLRARGTWGWGAPQCQDGLVGVVQLGMEGIGLRGRHLLTLHRQLTLTSTIADCGSWPTSFECTSGNCFSASSGMVIRSSQIALKRIASLLSCTGATGISITGVGQLVRKVLVARKEPISRSTRRHSSLSAGLSKPRTARKELASLRASVRFKFRVLVAEPGASLPRCLDSIARGRLHHKL